MLKGGIQATCYTTHVPTAMPRPYMCPLPQEYFDFARMLAGPQVVAKISIRAYVKGPITARDFLLLEWLCLHMLYVYVASVYLCTKRRESRSGGPKEPFHCHFLLLEWLPDALYVYAVSVCVCAKRKESRADLVLRKVCAIVPPQLIPSRNPGPQPPAGTHCQLSRIWVCLPHCLIKLRCKAFAS